MSSPAPSRTRLGKGLLMAGCVFAALAAQGLWFRHKAGTALAEETRASTIPVVSIATAMSGPAAEEIVLPGTVQGEFEAPIYARTSGYVKRWYVDIGAHVKAGQLLAEIASPEVDQALRQAQADLRTAEANNLVAQATAQRVRTLLPTQSVSKEQDDQATSDAAARSAAVASNEANVGRLRQLVGFERIVAPFAGTVTARDTDVGNLINAGSGPGPELFKMAVTRQLRIYVQVPQSYAALVHAGLPVGLQFPEYPDRTFPASLVRTAGAIDPQARTLLVEIEADNSSGELLPGGYADVHFKLPVATPGLVVAANALLFRAEGLRIATVGPDGRVRLKAIRLGHDYGNTVEVVAGLAKGDRVILNPPAAVQAGDPILIAQTKRRPSARS